MLDLETMGKGPNAAIIAIGAVEFGIWQPGAGDLFMPLIGSRFYEVVDLESSMADGGVCDASTILWWMQQSDEARAAFKRPGQKLFGVLGRFKNWLNDIDKDLRIWGNGADFDNVILASAYQRLGRPVPWGYQSSRCYRTVRKLYPEIVAQGIGVAHNALHDAEYQAMHLCDIMIATGNQLDGEALYGNPCYEQEGSE
jgi:exodeoxyribonuclease VIII